MARTDPAGEARDGPTATLPPRPRVIIKAVDLGSTAVLRHGALTLVADAFGDIRSDTRGLGLYLGDTRILSGLAVLVDHQRPTLLESDAGGYDRGSIQLTNPTLLADPSRTSGEATLATQSLGIRRVRRLGPNGFREQLLVTNFTPAPQRVTLDVALDMDGADIFEVRGYVREAAGTLLPIVVERHGLEFAYRAVDGWLLRTRVELSPPPDGIRRAVPGEDGAAVASWALALPPGTSASLGWVVTGGWALPEDRATSTTGSAAEAPGSASATITDAASATMISASAVVGRLEPRRTPVPTAPRATVETDDELLNLILTRALADIELLETGGPTPDEAFVAAGVPWYATLFGRDSLVTALFLLPVRPDLAAQTLRVLARRQATVQDDWRDAEPGKILHELRTGEMARTGELPFTPYYGSVDATPLWILLLAATHAWTGDDELVDECWPTALAAMRWLEHAIGGDLLRYERRSARGLANQGWKDSWDAVRDTGGGLAEGPVALVEAQAYAIAALRAMAGFADRRREASTARRWRARAARLRERTRNAFWQPSLRRYAMAIDGRGRPMDALASNVGHALWCGVVDRDHAAHVARDLAGPRLSSGWGLRTFATDQPGYNPLGYHLGTVWPHDTAFAVAGLRRYGFDREAQALAAGLLDAARHFPLFRLPELFCGFARDDTRVPVAYPVACAPHAWAAASPFMILSSLLGLEADARHRELRIHRPVLPPPVRKVVVRDLRVGSASVDLLFQSWRGETAAEVLRRDGDLAVVVRL